MAEAHPVAAQVATSSGPGTTEDEMGHGTAMNGGFPGVTHWFFWCETPDSRCFKGLRACQEAPGPAPGSPEATRRLARAPVRARGRGLAKRIRLIESQKEKEEYKSCLAAFQRAFRVANPSGMGPKKGLQTPLCP